MIPRSSFPANSSILGGVAFKIDHGPISRETRLFVIASQNVSPVTRIRVRLISKVFRIIR